MDKIIKKAFTLIELLVVIAIIGILSGLIVVTMSGVAGKANIAKGQVFSNSLRNALMLNLVSEWKFDELSTALQGTSIKDSWSGGNNGTLYTNSDGLDKLKSGMDCVSGKCLYFDGTDDYIDCGSGSNLNITGDITIGAWVKADTLTKYLMIVDKSSAASVVRQFQLIITNQGMPEFNAYDGTNYPQATSTEAIQSGSWYYVVGSRGGGLLKVYVNGVQKRSVADTATSVSDSNSVVIGRRTYLPAATYYMGSIDDVRIFSASIPTSQIKEQYYSGLNNLFKNGEISISEYSERINNVAQNE